MTRQQRKCLMIVADFIKLNGYSPSVEEIAAALGHKWKSHTHKLLVTLKDRGNITWLPRQARSIEIIEEPEPACAACNDEMVEGDWKSLNGQQVCIKARPCSRCDGGIKTVDQRKAMAA